MQYTAFAFAVWWPCGRNCCFSLLSSELIVIRDFYVVGTLIVILYKVKKSRLRGDDKLLVES